MNLTQLARRNRTVALEKMRNRQDNIFTFKTTQKR